MEVDEKTGHRNLIRGAEAPIEPDMIIVFRAGDLVLGVDIRHVREVSRMMPLSPLPNAGPVAGMITLRGESTAVVDLAVLLGVSSEHRDRRARLIAVDHHDAAVCLLVDQVDGLHSAAPADLETPPSVVAGVDLQWLDSVTRSATGTLISVINVDRMLSGAALAVVEGEPGSV